MPTATDDTETPSPRTRNSRPLLVAIGGSLMLWFAQPPIGWSLLAWVAPLPWLYLASKADNSPRMPYLRIWLAGSVYWLLAIHWIRLAHPATIVGLFFLAGYLGMYLPLFVMAVRQAVQRVGTPVWIAAPVVWTAIEWLQAHVINGFLMGALGHTQIENAKLVQIADLGGAYLVSALVMLVASVLFEVIRFVLRANPTKESRHRSLMSVPIGVAVALASIAATYFYGAYRVEQYDLKLDRSPEVFKRVAIIQGSERAVWTANEGFNERVMDTYHRLAEQAVEQASSKGISLDLMVWPEGAYREPIYSFGSSIPESETKRGRDYTAKNLATLNEMVGTPVLVGIDRIYLETRESPFRVYNSAIAVDRQGKIIDTYDKTHLVMFGEYIPGGSLWPGLYTMFGIGNVTPGDRPAAFAIEGTRYMPTICYETVIPHVVRRQVLELSQADEQPDVLVNITNDSWFYDSSELAMHLTCTRFRAIECRTPIVVAANGGLSANIDSRGRVLDVAKPMVEQVLLVDVLPGGESTVYLRHGDTFAIACLVGTVLVLLTRLPFVPLHDARSTHASRRS